MKFIDLDEVVEQANCIKANSTESHLVTEVIEGKLAAFAPKLFIIIVWSRIHHAALRDRRDVLWNMGLTTAYTIARYSKEFFVSRL